MSTSCLLAHGVSSCCNYSSSSCHMSVIAQGTDQGTAAIRHNNVTMQLHLGSQLQLGKQKAALLPAVLSARGARSTRRVCQLPLHQVPRLCTAVKGRHAAFVAHSVPAQHAAGGQQAAVPPSPSRLELCITPEMKVRPRAAPDKHVRCILTQPMCAGTTADGARDG
jgi:hypothetical protein